MRAAVVVSVLAVAFSLVANLLVGEAGYVLRNLAAAMVLLLWARRAGLRRGELGFGAGTVRRGVVWGLGVSAVVAAVLIAGVVLADVVPGVDGLLGDARADLDGAELAYATLVRIPLGTAFFEEVVFRGVLLALYVRWLGVRAGVLASAGVFGLWHVAPALVALEVNDVAAASSAGVAAVVAAVLVTAFAGVLFAWLRHASGSLWAPVLAHWAMNSLGLVAAAVT